MVDSGPTRLVAIVDDDGSVRGALLGLMKAEGIPAQAFASAEEFLRSEAAATARCLVTDLRMSGMSGLELQAELTARAAGIPVIFITAHGDAETRARALRAGAIRFFQKPFDDQELVDGIRVAMEGEAAAGARSNQS
jgi:FixJ family two-component response regulator